MDTLNDILLEGKESTTGHVSDNILREKIHQHAKDFKTSWVKLGQALYTVFNDKIFKLWGYEKFEYYVEKEIGIKKPVAMKLLKTYYFLEHEEPSYLRSEYVETTQTAVLPTCDTVNVLRLAKRNKELPLEEYEKLKARVFEEGQDGPMIRKDLTALMKQRKEVDPDEEREKRNTQSVRRFVNAFRSFKNDMEVLKLISPEIIDQLETFVMKLEVEAK